MTRHLLSPALATGLLVPMAAPGGCDCDPEPLDNIVCDFTVVGSEGDTIDFGAVTVNGGERTRAFVIANTGNVPLSNLAIAPAGDNADQYDVDVPEDFVVRPAEDESLTITFAPTQQTTLNARLVVTHPDLGADGCPVVTLDLLGEGVAEPPVDAGFPDAGPDGGVFVDAGFSDAGFIDPPDDGVVLPPNAVWRAYGGFEEARAGFAAVPLLDGTVLVVGGYGENGSTLDSLERFDPATGRSRIVARMAQARAEPGAVMIGDGRVAIVGGRTQRVGGVIVRTVELYDPATDTLLCPGTQAVDGACSDNSLGLLPEGRINPLVTSLGGSTIAVAAGRGFNEDGAEVALAGGETLDVLADAAPTAIPGIPARVDEARVTGPDGAFLLLGGRNINGVPQQDIIRFRGGTASPLNVALPATRAGAGVGVLHDGSVLVVGGVASNGAVLGDALLLEDPFGDASALVPLTLTLEPRVGASVAVLSGDVVVVAGGLPADVHGVGEDDSVVPLSTAEILVPFGAGFARFAPANDLASGRFGGAVVVNAAGDVATYLGGFATAPRKTPHPHAEQYRVAANAFFSFGLMGPGAAFTAAALPTSGAALLSIGGVDPHTGATSPRTRAFDAENGLFTEAAPLGAPRRDHTATSVAADLVVVIGGRDEHGTVLASASILDVDGGDRPLPVSLRRARANHSATLLPDDVGFGDNAILVCGGVGSGGEALDTCEIFRAPTNLRDPNTDATASFTLVAGRMSTGRVGHSATLLQGGEVLLVGGGDIESAQVAADLFNADASDPRIVATGVPVRARRDHAAVDLGGGRVLVVGGEVFEGGLAPTRSAEVYVRATGTFTAVEDMEQPRIRPAAYLLADGAVLIAGGTKSLGEPGFPFVSVVESELYFPGTTGLGTFEAVDVPLSYGRSALFPADVFGRAIVVGGDHRDGLLGTGDERRTPQHFVDVLEQGDE